MLMFSVIFLAALLVQVCAAEEPTCKAKHYGHDSVVCVCDQDHCDLPGPVTWPQPGHYTVVTSSRDGLRFQHHHGTTTTTQEEKTSEVRLVVDWATPRQTMLGFGGAFTDAAGLTIASLSSAVQDLLIRSYYSHDGNEYEFARVPIASCDFSTKPYSYTDVDGDTLLQHWALAEEDLAYKIPYLRRAMEVSQRQVKVVGSPWSPPAWMKTNGKFNESGQLLKEMWQPWAQYIVKFVEAYEGAGVQVWGITTQNDPLSGFDPGYRWNSLGWSAEDMKEWVKEDLGPALGAAGLHPRIHVLVHDNARDTLHWYPQPTLQDPDAARYVSGVAVHWYKDGEVGPDVLDALHTQHPQAFILYSEACTGFDASEDAKVMLGSWGRAEAYAANIMEGVNHWVTGWLDWNLALDLEGGPNWAHNRVDSPIIVNKTANEFYKQPMFYALGHFSKYVPEGSVHVASRLYDVIVGGDDVINSGEITGLHSAAFLHPDGAGVVVILNTSDSPRTIAFQDATGRWLQLHTPARAVQTVVVTNIRTHSHPDL